MPFHSLEDLSLFENFSEKHEVLPRKDESDFLGWGVVEKLCPDLRAVYVNPATRKMKMVGMSWGRTPNRRTQYNRHNIMAHILPHWTHSWDREAIHCKHAG